MSAPAQARELRAVAPAEAGPSSAQRKAALLLHAMDEPDRAWLLGQLTAGERQTLGALLGELRELGIPADRALLDEALARDGAHPAPVPEATGSGRSRLDALRRADPGRLAAVLRDEPAALVARLLQLSDWPWRGELLGSLEPLARREVQEELERSRGPGGALLDEHLVAAVLRRLEREVKPAGRGLSRWLRRRGGRAT